MNCPKNWNEGIFQIWLNLDKIFDFELKILKTVNWKFFKIICFFLKHLCDEECNFPHRTARKFKFEFINAFERILVDSAPNDRIFVIGRSPQVFVSAPSRCDIKVCRICFPIRPLVTIDIFLLGGLILVSDCWVGNSEDLMIKTLNFFCFDRFDGCKGISRFLYSCSRFILLTPVSSML